MLTSSTTRGVSLDGTLSTCRKLVSSEEAFSWIAATFLSNLGISSSWTYRIDQTLSTIQYSMRLVLVISSQLFKQPTLSCYHNVHKIWKKIQLYWHFTITYGFLPCTCLKTKLFQLSDVCLELLHRTWCVDLFIVKTLAIGFALELKHKVPEYNCATSQRIENH